MTAIAERLTTLATPRRRTGVRGHPWLTLLAVFPAGMKMGEMGSGMTS